MASFYLYTSSCVSALALYILYKRFTARISPTVPYAGEESLISRFKVLAEYNSNPVDFLVKQRKKLGDIFCVDLILLKTVYILGPEGNKAILHASEDDVSFWEFTQRFFGPFIRDELFAKDWADSVMKCMRISLMSAEMLKHHEASCEDLAENIFDSWTRAPNGIIPLFESFSDLIYAHFLVIFVGKQFYLEHGSEVIKLMENFGHIMRDPILQVVPHMFWSILPTARHGFDVQRRLKELFAGAARENFALIRQGLLVEETTYLEILCKNNDERRELDIGEHMVLALIAARANVSRTLPWLILHAHRAPEVLRKCRDEVQTSASDEDGIGRYLEACFRETGRLYGQMNLFRCIPQRHPDGFVQILNHRLPSGTVVTCSPAVTHRDPALFIDPEKWEPERFLADDQYSEWFRRREFVQFGAGIHACTGEKITRTVILKLVLKMWFRKYDLEVVSGLEDGKGIDGVGVEAAWIKEPTSIPPSEKEVFVKVVKIG